LFLLVPSKRRCEMRTAHATICVALVCALFTSASAQEAKKKSTPTNSVSSVADIAFGGGQLKDYVAEVRKKFPDSKIVVDGVGEVRLPAAPLPRVSLRAALEWVPKTLEARGNSVVLEPQTGRGADAVFVLTKQSAPRTPPPAERQAKDYNLSDEIRPGVKPAIVEAEVKEMLKLRQPPFEGSVAYDSKTQMLRVAGTAADIRLADHVVETMTQGQRIAAALPALRESLKRLEDRVAVLEKAKSSGK